MGPITVFGTKLLKGSLDNESLVTSGEIQNSHLLKFSFFTYQFQKVLKIATMFLSLYNGNHI